MTSNRKLKMKQLLLVILMISLCCGSVSADTFVIGELVCQMAEGESIDIVNSQFGIVTAQELPILNIFQLNITGGQDLDDLSADIELLPEVIFCHPNYLIDPLNGVQGSLPISDIATRDDYVNQPALDQFNMGSVLSLSTGSNVKVGILDGGVYLQHPEFAGNVVSGYDYVDDDPIAFDEPGGPNSGHGTFIAGVVRLMAPDAEIRVYRVTNINGESNGYIVAEAIMQAVYDGCQVINLSMVTVEVHKAITEALAYAESNDVLVVAAAGNGYEDEAHYPASDPNAIGVAAVNITNGLAEFSSFGAHVDICAPGVQICSPYINDKYAWWEGTSFAAPFITAQAALIYGLFPIATAADVRSVIISTADDIDSYNPGLEGMLGAGIFNPLASLLPNECGDVNADGIIDLLDILMMLNHLYNDLSLTDPSVGDVDDWLGINSNDAQRLIDYIWQTKDPLDCTPDNSLPFPASTNHIVEIRNIEIPPNMSQWEVEFWLETTTDIDAIVIPFTWGATAPGIQGNLVIDTAMENWANIDLGTVNNDEGTALLAFHAIFSSLPPGTYHLATMHLSNTFAADSQIVIIDTTTLAPGHFTMVSTSWGRNSVTPFLTGFGGIVDVDQDSVPNRIDNCPIVYNPGQEDADGDGVGDACDICSGGNDALDSDFDLVPDDCDNCLAVANIDQFDTDGDGVGDICDICTDGDDTIDSDSDGIPDDCDNCPDSNYAGQADFDLDGVGDICDNCPISYNPDQADSTGDGKGNACEGVSLNCGNINGDIDGHINITDFTYLISYLLLDGPAPPKLGIADVDNWLGVNLNDAAYFFGSKYHGGEPLNCDPNHLESFPVSTLDTLEVRNLVIPAGVDSWTVEIMLTASDNWSAISLPFSFECSNPNVELASIEFDNPLYATSRALYDNESQTGFIAAIALEEPGLASGSMQLATLHLSNTSSTTEHLVSFDTLSLWGPSNVPVLSLNEGANPVVPVIILVSSTVIESCCQGSNSGNTNCSQDGIRDLADITRLIDQIYISKNELCCEAEGNINGDVEGLVNLSDVTRLIDHVYISKAETAACE